MAKANPYQTPDETKVRKARQDDPAWGVSVGVLAMLFLLFLLLVFASGIYVTLKPDALLSGNPANPVSFSIRDVPSLIVWCVLTLAVLCAFIATAWGTISLMLRK